MEALAYAVALRDRIYKLARHQSSVSCSCNQAKLILMHLEAGMAAGCVTWLQAPGRSQIIRTTTAPHEVEKKLHELELLSLQGDSNETLHTYNHAKDHENAQMDQ